MQKYQGDIVLLAIPKNKLPKNLNFRQLQEKEILIAEGERTGHKHLLKVLGYPSPKIEIAQDENGYYLKVLEGEAVLEHNTHQKQILPKSPQVYFIGRQVEYDELEGWRKVQD